MKSSTEGSELTAWLRHMKKLHPRQIELGLERVKLIAHSAGIRKVPFPVIIVGGTNGKGSVVAYLSTFYQAAGYKTGTYTSPYILRFNEQINIAGHPAGDRQIVDALQSIESVRGDISLTFFEYATLAAMKLFCDSAVDVAILEVGLGGRLDAVNLWDGDISIITSIALDHESWLGNSREQIAAEKVKIARKAQPLIIGERKPPQSLLEEASLIGARIYCIQKDFDYSQHEGIWEFSAESMNLKNLPPPALKGRWQYDNAAVSVMATQLLNEKLPLHSRYIIQGLPEVKIDGRYQHAWLNGHPVILDVGHNPAAASVLVKELELTLKQPIKVVFAVMKDKAVDDIIGIMTPMVDCWYLGTLPEERAMPVQELESRIRGQNDHAKIKSCKTVLAAAENAVSDSEKGRAVLIFGSFHTVAQVAEHINT